MAPQRTLMLMPSGSTWMDVDRRPGRLEDARPDDAARAVRAVQDETPTGAPDVGGQAAAMGDVGLDQLARVDPPAEVGVAHADQLALAPDELLERVLGVVVELEPVAVEDLEAVVVGRVVRGRDHDPGRERARSG